MLMLKPFHNDFSSHPITLWTSYFQKHPEDLYYEVKQGQVIAQAYAFGGKWLNSLAGVSNGVANVLNTTDSPVYTITKEQVNSVYGGGPPYMATARDFYKISHHWTDFLPRYYAELPNMMNEMYSYSLAVAHLGLKHQLAKGFMISDTGLIHQEGWDFLAAPFGNDHDKMLREACNMSVYDQKSLPQVLHFCQRYGAGEFFLTKYKVPRRTFTCEFPMYVEPPIDVATAEYIHMGDFSIKTFNVKSSSDNIKRAANAFMVCSLYKALNEAATFYKDNHCNASNTNYEKSWQYFKVYDKDPHGPGMKGLSKSKP